MRVKGKEKEKPASVKEKGIYTSGTSIASSFSAESLPQVMIFKQEVDLPIFFPLTFSLSFFFFFFFLLSLTLGTGRDKTV